MAPECVYCMQEHVVLHKNIVKVVGHQAVGCPLPQKIQSQLLNHRLAGTGELLISGLASRDYLCIWLGVFSLLADCPTP